MKICHISDTHNNHRTLNIPYSCDVIACTGDVSNSPDPSRNYHEVLDFLDWFSKLPIPHKVMCFGNHDISVYNGMITWDQVRSYGIKLLMGTSDAIEGVNFWGSPFTNYYDFYPADSWAWGLRSDGAGRMLWDRIPNNTDILLTHGPPYGILDCGGHERKSLGSKSLRERVDTLKLKCHLFGHIHESSGLLKRNDTVYSNGYGNPKTINLGA